MKLIQKTDEKIVFQAEMGESLANAVRRYLGEILVLAADKLEISKNGSALYDETVAHRVGLIPLKMSRQVNEKTSAELKLAAKKEGFVYAEEMSGSLKVAYDKIPITFLEKGQELEFNAIVKAGKGSEHSKFSPGAMFYRNIPDIKIDGDCPKEVVDACPKGVLKMKDGKVVAVDTSKCDMCEACVEVCEKKGKDSIKITPTKELMITVESFGQLGVEEMIKRSVDVLKKDLDDVSKGLK